MENTLTTDIAATAQELALQLTATSKTGAKLSKVESLHIRLAEAVEGYDKVLANWAAKFASDPCYAMEWGMGALEAAASRSVLTQLMEASFKRMTDADEKRTHEELFDLFQDWVSTEAMRRATQFKQSSSPMSNMVEQYQTVMWAKIARNFDTNMPWF